MVITGLVVSGDVGRGGGGTWLVWSYAWGTGSDWLHVLAGVEGRAARCGSGAGGMPSSRPWVVPIDELHRVVPDLTPRRRVGGSGCARRNP